MAIPDCINKQRIFSFIFIPLNHRHYIHFISYVQIHLHGCTFIQKKHTRTHMHTHSCKLQNVYQPRRLQLEKGAPPWVERNCDCSLQTCKPPQLALSHNTQMLVLTHTKHTLQEIMAKLWEDSLFEKQEVVTSCIKPEYTSVIQLKIHWQPPIYDYLKSLKQNWE